MQTLDLAFGVEHLVQLCHRLLFVDLRRLHRCVQRFHQILFLPLQLVEARGCALNLAAHESLLLISQTELALMLHDHVRRKHCVGKRIVGRLRLPHLPLRIWPWRGLWFLGRHQRDACHCDDDARD